MLRASWAPPTVQESTRASRSTVRRDEESLSRADVAVMSYPCWTMGGDVGVPRRRCAAGRGWDGSEFAIRRRVHAPA